MGKLVALFSLNVFDAVLALATSIVQTRRIIRNSEIRNKTTLISLFALAAFAAAVSVYQSHVIIKKTSSKANQKVKGGNQKGQE